MVSIHCLVSRIWSDRPCSSIMMDLAAMEMRGRNGTEATGSTNDGVKSKEETLMPQIGKQQQLNV